MADDDVTQLAAEVYLYGFPLVFNDRTPGIGDFRPVLCMYEPAPEVLKQTYTVPPITRS